MTPDDGTAPFLLLCEPENFPTVGKNALMPTTDRAHLATILTRAAILEAARQHAAKAGDVTAESACARELAALRRAYYAAAAEGASRGRGGLESVRGGRVSQIIRPGRSADESIAHSS